MSKKVEFYHIEAAIISLSLALSAYSSTLPIESNVYHFFALTGVAFAGYYMFIYIIFNTKK